MRHLWPLLVLIFLSACATDKKAAIQLSEQGLYEAALPRWLKAFERDPDDVEVQVGLKICQEKVVNERLIHIRDLRLANNHEDAVANLKKLLDAEAEWKLALDFNSSTFQGKETEALWTYERSKLIKFANDERPLAAELRIKRLSHVFKALPDYAAVREGVAKSGQRQCARLKQHPKSMPFYGSYVSQFCLFFKPEHAKVEAKLSEILFGTTETKLEVAGVSAELASVMSDSLAKSFQTTPWFHTGAKRSIGVNIKGRFVTTPSSAVIPQVHSYTVEVPYTAYESVKKKRQVPYDSTYRDCRFDDTAKREVCHTRLITKYREETYWESEPVTRLRDDPREFAYKATKKTQEVVFELTGELKVGAKTLPFAFAKSFKEERIVHDMNLPSIGLRPAKEDLTPASELFKQLSETVAGEFAQDLNQHWIANYCAMPNGRDKVLIGEHVLRCRKAKDYPVAFVDSWFEKNHGLTSGDAEELLGQF